MVRLSRSEMKKTQTINGIATWEVEDPDTYHTEWIKGGFDKSYLRVIPDPATAEQDAWWKQAYDEVWAYHELTTQRAMSFAEIYLSMNTYSEQYPDGGHGDQPLVVVVFTPSFVKRALDKLVENGFALES